MSQNQESQNHKTEKEIMDYKLSIISQFNECDVLMKLLCEKMGLVPYKTTHQEFVNKFTGLVKEAMDYRKELAEHFISANPGTEKERKKAKRKNDAQLELVEDVE